MNIDEFIYVAEDRLDKDFCKHCIEKFNKDDNRYQGIVGSGENLEINRSVDLHISSNDDWKEEDDVFYKSFKDIALAYTEVKTKQNRIKARDLLGRLNNYVFPMFKELPIKEIKASHLSECLELIQFEYGYYETARRMRQDFINIYKFAVQREFIENNKADCMLSVLINTHLLEASKSNGVERFFFN